MEKTKSKGQATPLSTFKPQKVCPFAMARESVDPFYCREDCALRIYSNAYGEEGCAIAFIGRKV